MTDKAPERRTYNEDICRALGSRQELALDSELCTVSRKAVDEGIGLIRRLTTRVAELEAENARLREAFEPLLRHWEELLNNHDCGEEHDAYLRARSALSAEGEG